MSSSNENLSRANIRIEIKNDFSEEMDVEAAEENTGTEGEIEDGEISDCKENEDVEQNDNNKLCNQNLITNIAVNHWSKNDGGFTTGVDIFSKEEQERLQTRAKRFGLDPSTHKGMTDEQLQNLHVSLGISEENEIDIRFETIHMYGTQEMSTQDVFGYFGKYGPTSIEWINDESCNVVWFDKVSAARALHGLSKPVSGMPASGKCDPFSPDFEKNNLEKENTGRSILLLPKDEQDIVDISNIKIPIPPGYWRIGDSHIKAKYILLRFAKRTDKKPFKAEKFSEYYKKHGNPNYGGIKGLISNSKKNLLKGKPNFVISKNLEEPTKEVVKGNPWGRLAENWNNDILERPIEDNTRVSVPYQPKASKSILNRLGTINKRPHLQVESSEEESEEKEPTTKKSKVPRMRMYADEEEAKIKKAKELKKIKELEKITENMTENHDLRNRIRKQKMSVSKNFKDVNNSTIEPKTQPIKQEITVKAKNNIREIASESSEDELNVQQRSKVTVIVKKQNKPTVASTIWSRLDLEKRQKFANKSNSDSESSSSESSSSSGSESESENEHYDFPKVLNHRPGFNRDLKSRLGLSTDHKSPLRIEINNDHYKKT